jgi:hypothetical protein
MVIETLWVAPRQVYIALQEELNCPRQRVGLLTDFCKQSIKFNIGIALPSLEQVFRFCLTPAEGRAVSSFHKNFMLISGDNTSFYQDALSTARPSVMS